MKFYHSSRRGTCCKLPPLVKNAKPKYQKAYDQSFHIVGGKLWNLLPKAIKRKGSLVSFKTALSKYITQFPDRPPVPGIASDNSLLTVLASPWRNTTDGGRATSDGDDSTDEDCFLMASGH